jgi:hypothetical protein
MTLSLCSSLNARNQISYPCKTEGKIVVLYDLNYFFKQEAGRQNSELKIKIYPEFL